MKQTTLLKTNDAAQGLTATLRYRIFVSIV